MSAVSFTEEMHKKYPEILQTCFDISPPSGWEDIVDQLLKELTLVSKKIEVFQIKEKFGGLRVYLRNPSNFTSEQGMDVYSLVCAAEKRCSTSCAICGKEGTHQNNKGWWAVLCDEHK